MANNGSGAFAVPNQPNANNFTQGLYNNSIATSLGNAKPDIQGNGQLLNSINEISRELKQGLEYKKVLMAAGEKEGSPSLQRLDASIAKLKEEFKSTSKKISENFKNFSKQSKASLDMREKLTELISDPSTGIGMSPMTVANAVWAMSNNGRDLPGSAPQNAIQDQISAQRVAGQRQLAFA